ncbi:subtilisin-like protease-like [Hibiscus syriacus]|uniref:Subtilisin-like protease-like n=1 Tax=Hibiscus syriacus TaxID=106335 RepID=A0A6A2WUY3_HIBSY|nr:subtilisin-like protease-like [Hibiscus syriacus]
MDREGEQLCEAARNGDVAKAKSLIESGADVSSFNRDGLTPLMHAAKLGHTDAVKALSLRLALPGTLFLHLTNPPVSLQLTPVTGKPLKSFSVLAELILGTVARKTKRNGVSEGDYLEDRVNFSEDKLMDSDSKAVMMAWEKPLMEAHAKAVCTGSGNILNVGFGMGLVDTAIQQYGPVTHTIVESHREVYERMLQIGWGKKDNVKIIFGRWQNVLSQLESYDGIFFDTYGEYYEDLRDFHRHLPKLLKPGGIYSFFNGLCGGNTFFHVVYCRLVSLELENLGYSTQLIPLHVKDCLGEKVWRGVSQKYWQLDTYYLPVCQSIQETS